MAKLRIRLDATRVRGSLQKRLVRLAKFEHGKVMAADPAPMSFTRWVDGVEGAAEETVAADGTILYRYARFDEVVTFALETLREMSPVVSGEYRDSHKLYLNGSPVSELSDWQAGDDIAIINVAPYSRRLEIGRRADGRPFVVHVPPNIYQRAAKVIARRYGNRATIEFTFRAVLGGTAVDQAKAASSGQPWWLGGGKARAASGVTEPRIGRQFGQTAHNKSNVRYPAIVIREAGSVSPRRPRRRRNG